MKSRLTLAVLPLFAGTLLAACGDDAAKGDGRTAAGEVLEGTISDDMIALDQVRSQSPLAGPEKPKGEAGAATGETMPVEGGQAKEEPAAQAPAAPATPPADPIGAAVQESTGQ